VEVAPPELIDARAAVVDLGPDEISVLVPDRGEGDAPLIEPDRVLERVATHDAVPADDLHREVDQLGVVLPIVALEFYALFHRPRTTPVDRLSEPHILVK
jgi:hypothetical protein